MPGGGSHALRTGQPGVGSALRPAWTEDSGGWSGRPGRGQRSSGTHQYNLPTELLVKPKTLLPRCLEAQDAGNVRLSAVNRRRVPYPGSCRASKFLQENGQSPGTNTQASI